MSEAVQIELIKSIPVILVALTTLIATVVGIMRAEKKLGETDKKLDQIHTLTNSTATKQTEKIDELQTTVKRLIEERGEERGKLEGKGA